MNVLIVVGKYYPKADANVVCTEYLVDAIKKAGHQVFVAAPRNDILDRELEIQHNNKVYRFCSDLSKYYFYQRACSDLKLPLKMGKIQTISYCLSRAFNKLYYWLKHIDFEQVSYEMGLDAMADGIAAICKEEKIDLILSVSVPFTSHLSVIRAMKKLQNKPKWMIYMLDPYAGSEWVTTLYDCNQMKLDETEVFNLCDSIVMLNVLKSDYNKSEYHEYKNKIKYLKPTLFHLDTVAEIIDDGITTQFGRLSVLYAGTLYDTCRNNTIVFSVLEKMAKEEFCDIHIMGKAYPKCLTSLKKIAERNTEHFKLYGMMPYSFAKGSMQKADLLVNIGNDYTDIIPSKIFEYMASCKPILHFFRLDEDTALPYLKKYPLALCVDERSELQKIMTEIHGFLESIKSGLTIDKEQVAEIFADDLTPAVQSEFINIVNALVANK